jgi:hypothetical protein
MVFADLIQLYEERKGEFGAERIDIQTCNQRRKNEWLMRIW